MNAALLLRVSTDTQDLESQRNELIPKAQNLGYTVPDDLIFGQHITGRDDIRLGTRESIVNLKNACLNGKVDAIFVYEVSRLSRSSIDGRAFVRDFCEMGIPIYFKDRNLWTINPKTKEIEANNNFIIGLFFDFAEQELKTLKSRTMRGRRNAASKGLVTGGYLNYGYKKDEATGKVVIDDDEAPFIVDIFNKYASGEYSLGLLTKYANSTPYQNRYKKNSIKGEFTTQSGYKKQTSSTKWVVSVLRDMLKNTIYIGITSFQDIEKKVPAIIDIDTFNKVQERLKNNPKFKEKSRNHVHLLQKLVFCGHCNYLFYGHIATNGSGHYLCSSHNSTKVNCGNVVINHTKFETIIWDYIKSNSFLFSTLPEEEKTNKISQLESEIKEFADQIIFAEKNSSAEKKKIENLLDAVENGIFSVNDVKIRKEAIDKTIAENDRYIKNNKSKIQLINNKIEQIRNSEFTKELIISIESDRNQMKKLINETVEKIVIHKIDNQSCVLQTKLYGEQLVNILVRPRERKRFRYCFIEDSTATYLNGILYIEGLEKCNQFYFGNPVQLGESFYWEYYTFNELWDILEHTGYYSEYLPSIEYRNPKSKKPDIIPEDEDIFREYMTNKHNTSFDVLHNIQPCDTDE